jgi:hypothetical protein
LWNEQFRVQLAIKVWLTRGKSAVGVCYELAARSVLLLLLLLLLMLLPEVIIAVDCFAVEWENSAAAGKCERG